MDLTTKYLGLTLKNPIIVGSSGLTATAAGVAKLAGIGAGAVVLKSLFQEEIFFETDDFIDKMKKQNPGVQYFEYDGKMNPIEFYGYKVREDNLSKYCQLIRECKQQVAIPIIASINCFYDSVEWTGFATDLQKAGADALELNMFFPPMDFREDKKDREKIYFDTVAAIIRDVSMPVALKISHYFTNLGPMIQSLSQTGVKGLVLFNRFFSPDFDIDKMEVIPSFVFSSPTELAMSLRWIAIMSNKVSCDLAASTGVHDGESVIKEILAGAAAVQVVSALYKNGKPYLKDMLVKLENWMSVHRFNYIDDFRGKMSQEKSSDPRMFERTQFMKYFAGKANVIS